MTKDARVESIEQRDPWARWTLASDGPNLGLVRGKDRAERSVGALDAHASATRSLSGTCQSECLDERWLSGCASGGAGYSVESRAKAQYNSRGRPSTRRVTLTRHESVRRGVRHAPPARPVAPPIGGLDPRLTYGQIALPQRHSTARHCAVNRAAHPCTGRAASCPSSRLAQTSGTPGIQ